MAGLTGLWLAQRSRVQAIVRRQRVPDATAWRFEAALHVPLLLTVADELIATAAQGNGPLTKALLKTWRQGLKEAAREAAAQNLEIEVREETKRMLRERGLDRASVTILRQHNKLVDTLASGAYDGLPPASVGAAVGKLWKASAKQMKRLAVSEITQAQVLAKEAGYREMGVNHYRYVTARDSKVSKVCRNNAAGSPYRVGEGPLPMRDSHPNCRCTTVPVVE